MDPIAPLVTAVSAAEDPDFERAVKRAVRRIRKEIVVTATRIQTLRAAVRVVRPVTAKLKMDPDIWAGLAPNAQATWRRQAQAVRLQRRLDVAAARPTGAVLHDAADKLARDADRLGRHARLLHLALAYYRGQARSAIEPLCRTPVDRRGLLRLIDRFDSDYDRESCGIGAMGIVTRRRSPIVWLAERLP